MVTIDIVYQGSLRCVSQHGPSKNSVVTDAPVDNNGKGESFSPTDLLATALGTCMLTIMGIVAKRLNADLTGTAVRVEKHMITAPQRKIGRLVVAFTMPRALSREHRAAIEPCVHTCPVALSIHPDIVVDVSFTYPD
jgi:putative redox protein